MNALIFYLYKALFILPLPAQPDKRLEIFALIRYLRKDGMAEHGMPSIRREVEALERRVI